MAYDLSGDKITLNNIDYTKGIYKTVQDMVASLNSLADKHNSLDTDTENALNDLQNQIDNLTSLSQDEIDSINQKLTALKELLGEGDTEDQFLDVIDVLNQTVDALNAIKKNDTYNYLFNSDTGEITIDLSAYGFASKDDYEIMVSMNGDYMAPVALQVTKVDEKTAKVIARDLRHFAELNVKYIDGAQTDDNGNYPYAFPFTILVSYNKVVVDKKAPRDVTAN
jgi:uncharacterized protein YukE